MRVLPAVFWIINVCLALHPTLQEKLDSEILCKENPVLLEAAEHLEESEELPGAACRATISSRRWFLSSGYSLSCFFNAGAHIKYSLYSLIIICNTVGFDLWNKSTTFFLQKASYIHVIPVFFVSKPAGDMKFNMVIM